MTAAAIRERLYDYIRDADDKKIAAIYTLLEDQFAEPIDWAQDKAFVADLDERYRRYKAGLDKAYSWDEVEASINQLKQQRSNNG